MVLDQIILGAVQGITEWLPISSEGMLVFVQSALSGQTDLALLVRSALFLHLGTFLAALVYFREDVWALGNALVRYREVSDETRAYLRFILLATLATGVVSLPLFFSLDLITQQFSLTGPLISVLIGAMLLVTAAFHVFASEAGGRALGEITLLDSLLVGGVQGLAIIPGISRSGVTVSTLLLRHVDEEATLRLSFVLSLPAVLAGNIALNVSGFSISPGMLVGVLVAFVIGLGTIHLLIRLAEKINFAYVALLFGLLMLAGGFIAL